MIISWKGFRGMTARGAGALYMNDDKNNGDDRSRPTEMFEVQPKP